MSTLTQTAPASAGNTSTSTGSSGRDFSTFARCLWFYYSWQPVIRWMVLLVVPLYAAFWLIAFLSMSAHNLRIYTGVTLAIAAIFVVVIPFFTSGIAFRRLASNRQFMLASGAGYIAVLALLMNVLLIGLTAYLFSWNLSGYPLYNLLIFFLVIASAYLGLTQLDIPPWVIMFIGWLPIVMINSLRHVPASMLSIFTSLPAMLVFLILTIAGWMYALRRMRQGRVLKPLRYTNRMMKNDMGGWDLNMQTEWLQMIQSKHHSSATDSLLYNMLMNWGSRFRRLGTPMLLVILFIVLFGLMQEPPQDTRARPGFMLIILIMIGALSLMGSVEQVPRTKLLWLRTGNSRRDIWNIVETNLLRDGMVVMILSALLGVFITRIHGRPFLDAGIALATIACIMPFFAYCPLFFRQRPTGWNNFLLLVTLCLALIIVLAMSTIGLARGLYLLDAALCVGFLVLGLVARYAARRRFGQVDWMILKPRRIGGLRESQG